MLLISLDTLRADHLGVFGNERPGVSEVLDELAARGMRFTSAISQSPWTTPSHMSLMTSQYPTTHGVNQGWTTFLASRESEATYRNLPEEAVTLAEALRESGFATQALTGGATIAGEFGFAQGFDRFQEEPESLAQKALLAGWLEEWKEQEDERFFLFLHSFEVHAPYNRLTYLKPYVEEEQYEEIHDLVYTSPDVFESLPELLNRQGTMRRDVVTALYDGGVHAADRGLGWVFDQLDRLDLADETLIVVTSDHGEEFGEHNPKHLWDAHCSTVYDELIRVPLIVAYPGGDYPAGGVVPEQVELIDVAPTVLDLLELPPQDAFRGRSFEPLMRYDGDPDAERWAVSEATCTHPEMKSLRGERYKYVAAYEAKDNDRGGVPGDLLWEQLFFLDRDPTEQNPVYDPVMLAQMRAMLEERLREAEAEPAVERAPSPVKKKTIDRLRSLGYIQ